MNRLGRVLLYYVLPLLITGAMIAGFVTWFLHTYHRVENEEALPPMGEAGYNPLYALQKALQADGIDARSHAKLNIDITALNGQDTLVLYADPTALSSAHSQQLLEWVERGGHLLVQLPSSDFQLDRSAHDILTRLHVHVKTPEEGRTRVDAPNLQWRTASGEKAELWFSPRLNRCFEVSERPLAQWGDDEHGLVFARIAHGRGQVDVWYSLRFLNTDGLKESANQELALQTLAPNYRKGVIHLLYAVQMPSLWRTLAQKGWPIWLPLALALFAWLWRRMQRFGPWLPSPLPERRSLLEHVDASGEFLIRHQDAELLYTAVRDSFMARLRWRDPIAVALSGEAQEEAIAQRLGHSRAYVHVALQTPGANDRHAYLERVRRLIHMRNQL